MGLGLMAHLLSMTVHAVTANVFEYYYTFPVFWLFFGVYVSRCAAARSVA